MWSNSLIPRGRTRARNEKALLINGLGFDSMGFVNRVSSTSMSEINGLHASLKNNTHAFG